MKVHWVVQALAGTVALTLLQAGLSFLAPPIPAAPPALGPVLASNLLTAGVLAWIHSRLRGSTAARAGVLWLISGGIQALSLVEAVLFDLRIPQGHLPWLAAHALAVSGALAAVFAIAFRARPDDGHDAARSSVRPAWWRWAACAAAYVVLYFTAGTLVWPYVRDFYEASPMPQVAAVTVTQVFRGLAFAAIVRVLVRRLRATRSTAALASGVVLSTLGGVAPLLIPNPYLPDVLRFAHMPEVGISNLVFGLLAGWLLTPATAPAPATQVARARA